MRPIESSQQSSPESSSYRELRLLEEIQRTPEISQRQLARQLGVALGVANALVRGLSRRGYVRATQVGWKRWVYDLTPSGMNRKLQLTLEYIDNFVEHYRRVRYLLREELGELAAVDDSRLAVHGVSEMAELVYLALLDFGLNDVEFIDDDVSVNEFLGRPAMRLESADPNTYDRVIVASHRDVDAIREVLTDIGFSHSQIVTILSSGEQNMAEEPGQEG